ncbi:uncharacterized protein EV420DRAFT_1650431 [Desarmillaria tabescens]|uniref:Uncharacterized protein n=1 Tax=Armillaria tabescens TaxID=1929756 RepID=A0AA39JEN5_ARMTA|nr:uncharacterized protein EV420DRAFT_1650431 [Desarmillaria tabescens]KAK0440682.1 hypothetical protein EV420DRAFT_1650431 [Desarmillaria tabescens]
MAITKAVDPLPNDQTYPPTFILCQTLKYSWFYTLRRVTQGNIISALCTYGKESLAVFWKNGDIFFVRDIGDDEGVPIYSAVPEGFVTFATTIPHLDGSSDLLFCGLSTGRVLSGTVSLSEPQAISWTFAFDTTCRGPVISLSYFSPPGRALAVAFEHSTDTSESQGQAFLYNFTRLRAHQWVSDHVMNLPEHLELPEILVPVNVLRGPSENEVMVAYNDADIHCFTLSSSQWIRSLFVGHRIGRAAQDFRRSELVACSNLKNGVTIQRIAAERLRAPFGNRPRLFHKYTSTSSFVTLHSDESRQFKAKISFVTHHGGTRSSSKFINTSSTPVPLATLPQPAESFTKISPTSVSSAPSAVSDGFFESVSSGRQHRQFVTENVSQDTTAAGSSYFTPWHEATLDSQARSYLWKPDRSYSLSSAPSLPLKRTETKLGGGGTSDTFGVYHSSFSGFVENADACSFHDSPLVGDVYLHHVTQADGYQIFIYHGGSEGWVEADERSAPVQHPSKKHSNRRLALRGGFATPDWMSESAQIDHLVQLGKIEAQDEPMSSKP